MNLFLIDYSHFRLPKVTAVHCTVMLSFAFFKYLLHMTLNTLFRILKRKLSLQGSYEKNIKKG